MSNRFVWFLCGGFLLLSAFVIQPWRGSSIDWASNPDAGFNLARRTDRLVALEFGSSGCDPCRQMDLTVYRSNSVAKAMAAYVPIKVSVDYREGQSLMAKYHVNALPTLILLSANGGELERLEGKVPADTVVLALNHSAAAGNEQPSSQPR